MKNPSGKYRLLSAKLLPALTGVVLVLIIGILSSHPDLTLAQDTASTPIPACQPFFVTASAGTSVRTCASFRCGVVANIPTNASICVLGEADDPAWAQVDLNRDDPTSPIYYAPYADLGAGAFDAQPVLNACQPFLVNVPSLVVRVCASDSCGVVGELGFETWTCSQQYESGEYAGWSYIEQSETDMVGWVPTAALRPGRDYGSEVGPTPTLTTETGSPSGASVQSPNPDPPTITGELPPCQIFYVNEFRGNVRQCASTNCSIVETLEAGTPVCVLARAPQEGWLIVDRDPADPASTLYVMSEDILAVGANPQGATADNCYDWWQVNATSRILMRVCPGETCPTIKTLDPGTQVCAREYGGPFTEWVRIELPNEAGDGWVFGELLTPIGDSPLATPVLAQGGGQSIQQPTSTSQPTQPITQESSPTPLPPTLAPQTTQSPLDGNVMLAEVSLAEFNVRDMTLDINHFRESFRFQVPNNWFLQNNNVLSLDFTYSEVLPSGITILPTSRLDVSLDDILISSIQLDSSQVGQHSLDIPIPPSLLQNGQGEPKRVKIEFKTTDHCLIDAFARLEISSQRSGFQFAYQLTVPDLDLVDYPNAFYHRSLDPNVESVTIVLPDAPTMSDIQAGMKIAAGLGILTANGLSINVTTASLLTDPNTHLILVGQHNTHSLISALYDQNLLLTQRETDHLAVNGLPIDPSSGIVQLILNPANDLYAILVVTGQTPEAVLKAADAVTGTVPNANGSLAFAESFRPSIESSLVTEQTFEQLGYDNILLSGAGEQAYFFSFWVPPNLRLLEDAQVELIYNVSELVAESSSSSLSLWMNDELPLASISLSRDAGDSPPTQSTLLAPIPPNSLIPGVTNDLVVHFDADDETWECEVPESAITWLLVNKLSKLVLPYTQASFANITPSVQDFPTPFNSTRNLSDLLVSLPASPTLEELKAAYQLVASIASQTDRGEGFSPKLVLGDLPPNTDLSLYNIILLGRPTTNPVLAAINEFQPQLFVSGTDDFVSSLEVDTFSNADQIGLVKVHPSIWSDNRMMLIVSGNSSGGQANGLRILTSQDIHLDTLEGDLILFDGQTIRTISTENK